MSFATHLECSRCGKRRDHRAPANLCVCGGAYLVRYDLEAIAREVDPGELRRRPAGVWRYHELLPAEEPDEAVTLGEGGTPILPLPRLGKRLDLPRLDLMDEGVNPTGTFKARGASVGITRAVELGIREVALNTAGNAGGAWAAYGLRAGLKVHVAMPEDAPEPNRTECAVYGADLRLVKGLISDAGKLIGRAIEEQGWFDVCTLKEPYRIEGKKTLGLEIAEHYGWEAPDTILYPTGGGVGLIGIGKAYEEMIAMGWIDPPRMPRLVAVQSTGCAPIVRAFEAGAEESEFWEGAETLSSGLRVPKALGDYLVLRAIRETSGTAVAVSDEETLEALSDLARLEGVLACPEGAATLAAARRLRQEGWLDGHERVLLLNTGTAYKYPEALARLAGAGA